MLPPLSFNMNTEITISVDHKKDTIELTMMSQVGMNPREVVSACVSGALDAAFEMHEHEVCECTIKAVIDTLKAYVAKYAPHVVIPEISLTSLKKHQEN